MSYRLLPLGVAVALLWGLANLDLQSSLGFLKTRVDVGKYTDLSSVREADAKLR